MILQGAFELDPPLRVHAHVLGQRIAGQIRGHDLRLAFPRASGRTVAWSIEPLRPPDDFQARGDRELDWGTEAVTTPHGDLLSGAVRRVVLEFQVADDEKAIQLGDDVGPHLARWVQDFQRALEIYTGAIVTEDVQSWRSFQHVALWTTGSNGNARQCCRNGGTVAYFVDPQFFGLDHAMRAAEAASGDGPELAHELLREARLRFQKNERKLAVLHATTAAEVALTRWADGQDETVAEAMGKARGLHARGNVAREFGLTVAPPDRLSALGRPRNAAIHAGVVPDHAATTEALRVAHELVWTASPNPYPGVDLPRDDAHHHLLATNLPGSLITRNGYETSG
jgi:hypothetical protein